MKTIDLEYILQEFETYVTLGQPHNQTPIFLKESCLIAMKKACEQTVDLCKENIINSTLFASETDTTLTREQIAAIENTKSQIK